AVLVHHEQEGLVVAVAQHLQRYRQAVLQRGQGNPDRHEFAVLQARVITFAMQYDLEGTGLRIQRRADGMHPGGHSGVTGQWIDVPALHWWLADDHRAGTALDLAEVVGWQVHPNFEAGGVDDQGRYGAQRVLLGVGLHHTGHKIPALFDVEAG